MKLPIYQLDAFASALFRGNPAAVCPLQDWLPDPTLQSIAAENNLAETAFYIKREGKYHLRWFTPTMEVEICGHATVATAAVIWDIRLESTASRISFETRSGQLSVDRSVLAEGGIRYTLDFPARPAVSQPSNADLSDALGATPQLQLGMAGYAMCVFESEEQVRALRPQMANLLALKYFAVIATAPGDNCDFVSRFFAPAAGVPEDPVTGSAHTTLIPYWSERLGRKELFARQVSLRGGELWCEDRGDRVGIGGHAVKYLEGWIEVA